MTDFLAGQPTLETYWRSIILFGKNVACYKLALGKSLLELAPLGKATISLEELAEPFSRHVVEHMRSCKAQSQATEEPYPFLNGCDRFIKGEISESELIQITVKEGFNAVLDRFHNLNGELPVSFFEKGTKKITIKDELFKLQEIDRYNALIHEVESRWQLVESVWDSGLSKNLLVNYDNEQELIFLSPSVNFNRRVKTTSSRSVLNGYQKGKCFYCGCDIDIHETRANKATACDVDHFFAFSLVKSPNSIFTKYEYSSFSINNIWNLVLSCKKCNSSKSNHLPEEKFLQKLHRRNEYYIQSDRPVGKTIRHHTGRETKARWQFLSYCYERVKTTPNPSFNSSWKPAYEYDRPF